MVYEGRWIRSCCCECQPVSSLADSLGVIQTTRATTSAMRFYAKLAHTTLILHVEHRVQVQAEIPGSAKPRSRHDIKNDRSLVTKTIPLRSLSNTQIHQTPIPNRKPLSCDALDAAFPAVLGTSAYLFTLEVYKMSESKLQKTPDT